MAITTSPSHTGIELAERLEAAFRDRRSTAEETPALGLLREKAFRYFTQLGFPTSRNEDWKYSVVAPYLKENYELRAPGAADEDIKHLLERAAVPGMDCYRVVLVNGRFTSDLSDFPASVVVSPLLQMLSGGDVTAHFSSVARIHSDAFAALNTALFQDGIFIDIPEKVVLDRPLHVVHVYHGRQPLMVHPRSLIVARAGSKATILETSIQPQGKPAVFVNGVCEIFVQPHARLEHYRVQAGDSKLREVNHTQVSQESDSFYHNATFSLPGAAFIRNNLNIALAGRHVETHLYGLYLAADEQLIDNHTEVDHREPSCHSNELYKGVLKDRSKAVFNGKIFVREDAQKTNAFQKNNNLLLSDEAIVHAKPQLEIFADDVKCSHGCTIGNFNPDSLFYLRSRGIGESSARALLVRAFAHDITSQISNVPLRAYVEAKISQHMESADVLN